MQLYELHPHLSHLYILIDYKQPVIITLYWTFIVEIIISLRKYSKRFRNINLPYFL